MRKISNIIDGEYNVEKIKCTPIQEFYKNQIVFITGGTGFIGKYLIEKLLRSCSGISRIYVLIREKKGQDLHQRMQDFLEDTVFSRLRIAVPDFEKKIIGIAGDISLENLGLSEVDLNLLKKVSIIFHSAATVRFNEPLKRAVVTNLQGTATILDFCKDMENLKAFVYVSTAYAHCFNNPIIEEKFYDYSTNYKDLLLIANYLSDTTIETITPALTKSWLNTYTCSKASAENFLAHESKNVPVAIFRPSTVTASAYEPMPGWIDNYNGTTGVLAGIASGVIRTVYCNPKKRIDLVPLDFTVNALIACAWDVNMQMTRRGENMLIYNFTSASDAPITFGTALEFGLKHTKTYPFSITLWYPSLRFNNYKFINYFYMILLHLIPAYFIDLVSRIVGRTPRMMKFYKTAHKMCDVMQYVGKNEWDFKNENVRRLWNELESTDQKVFQFTMQGFDWEKYFSTYIKGIRIYLLKDDLKTLDASKIKYKRLFWMNQVMRAALIWLLYYTIQKFLEITTI